MQRLNFKEVVEECKGGGTEYELRATPDARVIDLMAAADSDAIWLRAEGESLGRHLDETALLSEVVDGEKSLNIVACGVIGKEGSGDAAKISLTKKS
jgi:hypothetical protein